MHRLDEPHQRDVAAETRTEGRMEDGRHETEEKQADLGTKLKSLFPELTEPFCPAVSSKCL